jgi:branched-chain amino acid transport system ATP-binding protein
VLEVRDLDAAYGELRALVGVGVEVRTDEIVALVGSNGAGKTTLLRCIAGLTRPRAGSIRWQGQDLAGVAPHRVVERGVALVPEGRRLFGHMTVEENLSLGAFSARANPERQSTLHRVYEIFPRLAERRRQLAGSLSGGEQQMLALARALMLAPRMLLIDEPSVGLAPILVSRTIDKIQELKDRYRLTVLMAEQNFTQASRIADRGYVIVHGKIAFEGRSAQELNNNDLIRKFYLGL